MRIGTFVERYWPARARDAKGVPPPRSSSQVAAFLEAGDTARNRRSFADAAEMYRKALDLDAENAAIHIQCGHMLKELGDFEGAEQHYVRADQLAPGDADLALQFGHLSKLRGRLEDARNWYERATHLRPEWQEPVSELANVERLSASDGDATDPSAATVPRIEADPSSKQELMGFLISRADAARDDRQFRNAAALYLEALRLEPENSGIRVICGHMFKESGDLQAAETQYLRARQHLPADVDLTMQFGHLYKLMGRIRDAAAAYRQVAALRPDWWEPAAELTHLAQIGWRGLPSEMQREDFEALRDLAHARSGLKASARASREALRRRREQGALVPEIVPREAHELWHEQGDSLHIRSLGQRGRSDAGILQVLRGVEAIRGFCLSCAPMVEAQVFLNGQLIHRASVRGGYPLRFEKRLDLRKYVFNLWIDFTPFEIGVHELEIRVVNYEHGRFAHFERIAIAEPLSESDHPNSQGIVTLSVGDDRPLDQQINSRPSVVRSPRRNLLPPIRNVLVLRTDQLGDMVTSIPAMRRLKELLPDSRIVGLLTTGNADLARTLELFDEIIVVDFPDDRVERRRVMTFAAQEELRLRLEPYRFDLALDLAEASTSRPLLLLSGAPFLYGFHDGEWPWLTAGFEGNSRDVKTGREIFPQSSRVLSFIERLGAMLVSRAEVIRREDLTRARLQQFGLRSTDRFVVMHAGARIEAARWPHYVELATLLIQRTDLHVVLITDNKNTRAALPSVLSESGRFQLLDYLLNFDDFDALVSFCSAMVGNDSGPKHLASLRGVHVVSVHPGRVNWQEWGHEMVGSIISRKVPCAGCQLVYDNEECGRDYICLTAITAEEVLREILAGCAQEAAQLRG